MLMVSSTIEQLPANLRRDVERYLKAHSSNPAARLRPAIGIARNVWVVFVELSQQQKGNMGAGKTPAEAFERFDEAFGQIRAEREGEELVCDSRSFKMQPSYA